MRCKILKIPDDAKNLRILGGFPGEQAFKMQHIADLIIAGIGCNAAATTRQQRDFSNTSQKLMKIGNITTDVLPINPNFWTIFETI